MFSQLLGGTDIEFLMFVFVVVSYNNNDHKDKSKN